MSALVKLWRTSSVVTRLGMMSFGAVAAISTGNIIQWAAVGIMGGQWDEGQLLHNLTFVMFAYLGFSSIYWRNRAEKALEPTQVVTTYSTVGAADIARRVELERSRRAVTFPQESAR